MSFSFGTKSRKETAVSIENMVARDGIEPPTPAFSGLLTDNAKWFRINGSSWLTGTYASAVLGLLEISLSWWGRGENASRERRAELRKVAYTKIDELEKQAKLNYRPPERRDPNAPARRGSDIWGRPTLAGVHPNRRAAHAYGQHGRNPQTIAPGNRGLEKMGCLILQI